VSNLKPLVQKKIVVNDCLVGGVVKNVKKNVKKNVRHEKKREQKREQKGEKRERVENKYLVKILYNIYNIYMRRSKSKRGQYEKVENYKKPKEEDLSNSLNEGFGDGVGGKMEERRTTHGKLSLRKKSQRTGNTIRDHKSMRTLRFKDGDVVKSDTRSKRNKPLQPNIGTYLSLENNPKRKPPPSPKKKSCCERWFRWGSKKRNKKCKKKCKTRKRKRKKRTKKKKIKRKR
jgi:hypothetical protein